MDPALGTVDPALALSKQSNAPTLILIIQTFVLSTHWTSVFESNTISKSRQHQSLLSFKISMLTTGQYPRLPDILCLRDLYSSDKQAPLISAFGLNESLSHLLNHNYSLLLPVWQTQFNPGKILFEN